MVITTTAVTPETIVITTNGVTPVTTTSRIALAWDRRAFLEQMPFSSGKKAVIFNRADDWDFSSYREVRKRTFLGA
jgi:hypothetical protein